MMRYRLSCRCGYRTRFRARWWRHERQGCSVFPPLLTTRREQNAAMIRALRRVGGSGPVPPKDGNE